MTAHDSTLFHLVPDQSNQAAAEALSHPENQRFVSPSAENTPGLEIGFHVPPVSHGNVITKLGRNTDLVLQKSHSAVHIAFEVHPETLVVMLSVRRKRDRHVSIVPVSRSGMEMPQWASGDCALLYGQEYRIKIASYAFRLLWRTTEGPDQVGSLKDLTIQGYNDAMQRLEDVSSRHLSVLESSTANSWYRARLQSVKAPLVTELPGCRVLIGEGGFGKVYRTIDQASGKFFAVKQVDLDKGQTAINLEIARAALHREIRIMKSVSHASFPPFDLLPASPDSNTGQDHIIECLGTKDLDSDTPLIFMPLCQGTLHSLLQGEKASYTLCDQVLHQMLKALDYLAFHNYCHRDVKPLNILYQVVGPDKYRFQLADFGFANDVRKATTFCGTSLYLAPEVDDGQPQTPKMDIWSLFVTMAEIHPEYHLSLKNGTSPKAIIKAICDAAKAGNPQLQPMARKEPTLRASAAQMLVAIYDGEGLTTPRNQIQPIEPDVSQPATGVLDAQAAPRRAAQPPVEYPRLQRQQQGRTRNESPPEEEPLGLQPGPERTRLPTLTEARPAHKVGNGAQFADRSGISAFHLPGAYPESRRWW